MSCYHHLTIEERENLYAFSLLGYSIRKIASKLGRSPSTISRELKRNLEYRPSSAQTHYEENRKRSVRKPILQDLSLRIQVQKALAYMYWSPEQIANRFKQEGKPVISTSTIYRALDNGLLRETARYYLRIKYKTLGKSKKPNKKCFSKSISDRSQKANDRTEAGHFEGDTIVSKNSKNILVTLVDRKTRFLIAGKVKSKEAKVVRSVVVKLLQETNHPVKSITFDQGIEFSEGKQMEEELGIPIYFAHAHSPWERPTNENTNGLLRQFIPKHKDINEVSDKDVVQFVHLLNLRPRKCLNWLTPFEAFSNCLLHLT